MGRLGSDWASERPNAKRSLTSAYLLHQVLLSEAHPIRAVARVNRKLVRGHSFMNAPPVSFEERRYKGNHGLSTFASTLATWHRQRDGQGGDYP